jgi:hypothetical protein
MTPTPTRHRARAAAVAAALAFLLAACTGPSGITPPAAGASLAIEIDGLPALVEAPVELIEPNGASVTVPFSTVRYDLATGLYRLRAFEQSETGIRYLPDLSEAMITLARGDAAELNVTYVPACDSTDRAAREACASLPWYPQGYLLTALDPLRLSATVQALTPDGRRYEASEIARVDTERRYFTMELPRALDPFRMDAIGKVIEAFTFDGPTCTRDTITISDLSVRGNDLFLDAYDPSDLADIPWESPDDETQAFDPYRGEVFLIDQRIVGGVQRQQLIVWIYANAPVSVRGSEICGRLVDSERTWSGGRLDFDLDLLTGWNLVAFDFADSSETEMRATIRAVAGPSAKAFGIVPPDFDANEDPPGVAPESIVPTAPSGYLSVPTNEFGGYDAPFNRPFTLLATIPGAAAFDENIITVASAGTVSARADWFFELSLTDGSELTDARLSEFQTTKINPDSGENLCSGRIDVDTRSGNPLLYTTLSFDLMQDGSYRAFARLMYDSTVATWWWSKERATITTSAPQRCRDGEEVLTETTYDLRLEPGWNVVYSTVTDTQEIDDGTEYPKLFYATTFTTTAPDVPFLYWRTMPDQRSGTIAPETGEADRGSDAGSIRGSVPASMRSDVRARSGVVAAVTALDETSIGASGSVASSGAFNLTLPDELTLDPAVFTSERLLPNPDLYQLPNDADCPAPTLPAQAVALIGLRIETGDTTPPLPMGSARLRGTGYGGLTHRDLEWVYAAGSARLRWVDDSCVFRVRDLPTSETQFYRRPVTFDIDLNLSAGWNLIERVRTIDPSDGGQTFTWRRVNAVPTDRVTWFADLTNRDPGTPPPAPTSLPSDEPQRPQRSLLRAIGGLDLR